MSKGKKREKAERLRWGLTWAVLAGVSIGTVIALGLLEWQVYHLADTLARLIHAIQEGVSR